MTMNISFVAWMSWPDVIFLYLWIFIQSRQYPILFPLKDNIQCAMPTREILCVGHRALLFRFVSCAAYQIL
jgi:hypothetical protein